MKCTSTDIKELLPFYLEQAIEQPDRERVDRHLETCADCRSELALLWAMAGDTVPDPGETFWNQMPSSIYHQVKEREVLPRPRFTRFLQNLFFRPRLAWAAAAAVLLAALAWLLMVRGMQNGKTVIVTDADETIYEQVYPAEPVDVASLGDEELKKADVWADQAMAEMGNEAGAVLANENDGELYDEIADLDKASLDRLSTILDAMKKEGRS